MASLHSACKSKGGEAGAALPVLELAILLASLVMIPLGAEPLPRLALILEECQRGVHPLAVELGGRLENLDT